MEDILIGGYKMRQILRLQHGNNRNLKYPFDNIEGTQSRKKRNKNKVIRFSIKINQKKEEREEGG